MAEIRMVAFGFAPRGWMLCQGQLLSIPQNQPLFSLIGTAYGGDGRQTFALPRLNGASAVSAPNPGNIGVTSGQPTTTLTPQNLPAHTHQAFGSTATAAGEVPTGSALLGSSDVKTPLYYSTAAPNTTMSPQMIGGGGGAQPVSVMQPYIAMNFAIAIQGIYPSRG
jgi:microcystin-dependent protein